MKINILITDEAETDTIRALDYCDEINRNLGKRVLDELQFTYKQFAFNP